MARHVLAILSAVHGAGRAHGALHPTAVEVEYEGSERVRLKYEGSERVRLKVLPTCLLCFSWENLAPDSSGAPVPGRRRRQDPRPREVPLGVRVTAGCSKAGRSVGKMEVADWQK